MAQPALPLPAHYRRNFVVFLADYICYGIAFTFINPSAVLPAFVRELTDLPLVIGLVGTVLSGGWLIPQLGAARHMEGRPRKKPYLIAGILLGRPVLWVVALALFLGGAAHPAPMLALFFAAWALFNVTDGIASVAWFDLLAKAIPLVQRRRLISIAQITTGLLGLGVSGLVSLILGERGPGFPINYGLLFALAGLGFLPSTVALGLLREPAGEAGAEDTAEGYLRQLASVWRSDARFRRLMAVRLLLGLMQLATTFYVVHARDVMRLPQGIIGGFVAAQMVGGVVASLGLSLVSVRWGPQSVIRIGMAVALVSPLYALAAHLMRGGWMDWGYPCVFFAMGVMGSSFMLGFFNYLLEIAPESLRPTYVGLSNTLAGVSVLAPILGGWLLQLTSYPVLFGITAAGVAAGLRLSFGLRPADEGSQKEATA